MLPEPSWVSTKLMLMGDSYQSILLLFSLSRKRECQRCLSLLALDSFTSSWFSSTMEDKSSPIWWDSFSLVTCPITTSFMDGTNDKHMKVSEQLRVQGLRMILNGWHTGWSLASSTSSNTGQGQFCTGCVSPPFHSQLSGRFDADICAIAFYYLFKTIIVLWLALPQFRGAEYVYHAFLRPVLARHIAPGPGVPGTPSNLYWHFADAGLVAHPHST